MDFNLAPLSMRRDIALLGMIHRAAIGDGPPQLRDIFKRRPDSLRLIDVLEGQSPSRLIQRSIWALVQVYNRLGSGAQSILQVKDFQYYLQERVKRLVTNHGVDDWSRSYSPRCR